MLTLISRPFGRLIVAMCVLKNMGNVKKFERPCFFIDNGGSGVMFSCTIDVYVNREVRLRYATMFDLF